MIKPSAPKGEGWRQCSWRREYAIQRMATSRAMLASAETLGWQPTCGCTADTQPATVLRPLCRFSGTLRLAVAQALGRQIGGAGPEPRVSGDCQAVHQSCGRYHPADGALLTQTTTTPSMPLSLIPTEPHASRHLLSQSPSVGISCQRGFLFPGHRPATSLQPRLLSHLIPSHPAGETQVSAGAISGIKTLGWHPGSVRTPVTPVTPNQPFN